MAVMGKTWVKALLLLLEIVEKRRILKSVYAKYPPEATGGIFNRFLFWWLNPLFKTGFSKLLSVEDLYTLDKQLTSKTLHNSLETMWNDGSKPQMTDQFILEQVTMGQYQHMTYRAITMVRGAVVSMVYRKATTLSVEDADPASSLTLMSADIERIVQGWQTIHDIWGNALEIGLAIFLLEQQLGVAAVVAVGVAVVALAGSLISLVFVMSRQAMWLEAIERRISSTTSMLASMKGIKMLGLSDLLMTCIHNLRLDELRISRNFRKLLVWNMAFAWTTRIFAPIFAFGAFVGISHKNGNDAALNTSTTYTSLSLFALLADPLLNLVMALMTFLGSVGSFQRIQEFLEKKGHVDSRDKSRSLQLEPAQESKQLAFVEDSETLTDESSSAKSEKEPTALSENMVTIKNGAFGWDTQKEPLLKSLTITIPRQTFTMLVGPSGCGKSTLLKAILGEVPCLNGTIILSSERIAYCDQTPWHMNGSIKQSIVAMSGLDEDWYLSVIRACALVEDFKQLPRGDQTIIGSKGIALSGGQSQRIALARAVYARKDIIVLDDVLSSLDATTEEHIFQCLVGTHGLLRSIGSTILLSSSSIKRVPFADHIIVLGNEGHVTEQGSFKALDLAGGYISSFALGLPEQNKPAEKTSNSEKSDVQVSSVEQDEDSEVNGPGAGGDISIYLYYVKSIGWLPTLIFIIAITGFVFCISFPSIWMNWWASSNEAEPGKHTGYYLGIYAMLGTVGMLCLIVGCCAPMLYFSKTDSGAILNRFSQDLQLIDMELPVAAINAFVTFVLCICQMVFIGIASKYAAISFPAVILAVYGIQKVYLRTSRQLRFLDLEAKAPLYSHFADCLGGLVTLRAFGWQQAMEEKNHELLDYSQRPFYLLYAIQRWLTLTLDLVVAGIAVLLIVLVVVLRGSMSAGYVGVALLNVILFSQSIKLLVTFWTNLETHIGSILRVKMFSENVPSENLPTENDSLPPDWPSQGNIVFDSVSAEYSFGASSQGRIFVYSSRGESGDLRQDWKVRLVAYLSGTALLLIFFGSGKTSLLMSVFRMVELSSGSIQIDGVDISKVPRQEVRSRINGVAQSPLLIRGSVRENIDPTGCHTDKSIMEALRTVQLSSKVQENGGLGTEVDELFLSHGQKQLFCLARAILRQGNILVLDEATSSVDTVTDEIMQRVIRERFSNHTILTVAHKLETILDYDKIIVLNAGRIVESGSPYALLASDTSHFSKLYASSMMEEAE
ncbi:P-loop containing nucleoside triphosphate hydrolase protein [Aspergillus parasiticus]|uniref:P-loop containing nucleoside triphosphate hydrolase protein n=1 Tax=Aspergillus parasiticus TaxID=5067 RepID=A0A5N6DZ53_ASPPA|nr:P-loop containing nucleoside triphosphate hydrolase protein [Aspergillus parasiticus]